MDEYSRLEELIKQQITWQLSAVGALQAKTIGLIGFDGAISAFVAVWKHAPIGRLEGWVFLGLGLSVLAGFLALVDPPQRAGPMVDELYGGLVAGTFTVEDVQLTVVEDLVEGYLRNGAAVHYRRVYWTLGSLLTVASLVFLAVVYVATKGW